MKSNPFPLPQFRIDGHPLPYEFAVQIECGQVILEDATGLPVLRLRAECVEPAPGVTSPTPPLMRRLTADDTAWDQGGQA